MPYEWPTAFPNLASIPQPVASGAEPPVVTLLAPEWLRPTPTPPPAVTTAVAPPVKPQEGSIEALICSYPWPCQEALAVARAESGLHPYAYNASGACGLFQLLPCACVDPVCNVEYAYRVKWLPTRSFYTHWYAYWR